MKNVFLLAAFLLPVLTVGLTVEERKEAQIQVQLNKPFNPFSISLPKDEILSRMSVLRVMDMGASCYANGFLTRALYFYNKVILLFPDELESVTWAHYEVAFIYQKMGRKAKAVEHLNFIQGMAAPDPIAVRLAQNLSTRLLNPKEYRVYRKQEDIVFTQDKRQKRIEDRKITREEDILRKIQAAQRKERKKLEKEDRRREKEERKAAAQKS